MSGRETEREGQTERERIRIGITRERIKMEEDRLVQSCKRNKGGCKRNGEKGSLTEEAVLWFSVVDINIGPISEASVTGRHSSYCRLLPLPYTIWGMRAQTDKHTQNIKCIFMFLK